MVVLVPSQNPENCSTRSGCSVKSMLLLQAAAQSRIQSRLVMDGFPHPQRIDYEETLDSALKFAALCFLAIVATGNLDLPQMEWNTAFVNSDLIEDVYLDEQESLYIGANFIISLNGKMRCSTEPGPKSPVCKISWHLV